MRFIGKLSVEASKFLFFYEDASTDISTAASTVELVDILSRSNATTLSVAGTGLKTTKVAASDSGAFLHIGCAATSELSGGPVKALLPSYPVSSSYRNGRALAESTIQTDKDYPYAVSRITISPTNVHQYPTYKQCKQNSLFMIRPGLRGVFNVTLPKTEKLKLTGSTDYNSRNFSLTSFARKFGTDIEIKTLTYTASLSGGGYSNGYRAEVAQFHSQPVLPLASSDYMFTMTDVLLVTGGSGAVDAPTGYTASNFPRVGKVGVVPTSIMGPLAKATLPYYNSTKKQIEYIELYNGKDFISPAEPIDGQNLTLTTLLGRINLYLD